MSGTSPKPAATMALKTRSGTGAGPIDAKLCCPEAIDDCMGPENPVQFIDAFVEGLDLGGTGIAGVERTQTGRPGRSTPQCAYSAPSAAG